jgi:hypothetical protein
MRWGCRVERNAGPADVLEDVVVDGAQVGYVECTFYWVLLKLRDAHSCIFAFGER